MKMIINKSKQTHKPDLCGSEQEFKFNHFNKFSADTRE